MTGRNDPAVLSSIHRSLWPAADLAPSRTGGAGFEEYAVIGNGTDRHILVPLSNRRVAAATLDHVTADTTVTSRVEQRLAAAGFRTGLLQPLLRTRVSVRTRGSSGATSPTLHDYVAGVLGLPHVEIAVTFGPDRPNQKPLLRIMTRPGQTIAYAKVGWNELTRGLVDREAAFLTRVPRARLEYVRMAEVLHLGDWQDKRLLILTAVGGGKLRLKQPAAAAFREVAELDSVAAERFSTGLYHRALERQIANASLEVREVANAALAMVTDRWGSTEFRLGRWHGDWTPWNMAWLGDRVVLWDWERTEVHRPVGMDALHFFFQPQFLRGGSNTVIDRALDSAGSTLTELAVPLALRPALACLYLLEIYLRMAASAELVDSPTAHAIAGKTRTALEAAITSFGG